MEKPDEKNHIREFEKQLKQLGEALSQAQAENIISEEFLCMACGKLGNILECSKKKVKTRS